MNADIRVNKSVLETQAWFQVSSSKTNNYLLTMTQLFCRGGRIFHYCIYCKLLLAMVMLKNQTLDMDNLISLRYT